MIIKFTKRAEADRLLSGISVVEIEEAIKNGIRSIKGNVIKVGYGDVILEYVKKKELYLVKKIR